MEKKNKRNSSIELLRILCMLGIISQHYVFHGGFDDSVFSSVSTNIIYLKMIKMFGYSACTVFALITGYYMINLDTEKNYYRRIIHLMMVTVFYSVFALIVLLLGKYQSFSFKELYKMFLPFLFGNWYVVFYILILFFIPFINKMLKVLDFKEYKKLIVTMFILFIVIQNVFGDVYQLGNFDFMLMGYIFGAFYNLHHDSFKFNTNHCLYIFLICFVMIAISVPVMDYVGVMLDNYKFIKYDYTFMGWNNLLSFIMSVSIFIYAVNKQFYNRLINIISSTVIGVYLLHDGPLKSIIWEKIWPNISYVDFPYFHSIIKILLVFIICVLFDLLRQYIIDKPFKKLLYKICDRYSI